MKVIKIFFLSLCVLSHSVVGQLISGTVYSAHTELPLENVFVTINNTANFTYSDSLGNFYFPEFKEQDELNLTFSLQDFESAAVLLNGENMEKRLTISLKPLLLRLNKEVVVSAQRYPTNQFDSPEAISVLDKRSLQEISPGTVPEALMYTTGVWMQKTNHGGGSPFIRGLTGQQTLLMVDGIRMNNATYRSGPNQYLNTVDPFYLEQIEVVRGSGSVQYGSDALGGVVQMLTRSPKFSQGNVNFFGKGYGKFLSSGMEQSTGIELGASSDKFAVAGSFVWRNFGDIKAGKGIGKLDPTGYGQLAGDFKSLIKISNNHLVTLAYQDLVQDDVPLFHKVELEDFQYSKFVLQQRQLGYARLESFYDYKLIKRIQLTGSLQISDERRESLKNGSELETNERDKIKTWGVTALVHSEPHSNWKINSGIEYYYDDVRSSRFFKNKANGEKNSQRALYPDGSEMSSLAIFTLHTLDFKKFIITTGARLNGFDIKVKEENSEISTVRINPLALVGNFSALYKVHPNHHIIFSVNNAFRSPNIDDLGTLGIVDFRYEIPNKSLEPEKSLNMEIGFKSRAKHFSSAFSIYRNNLTNVIDRVRAGNDSINGYQVYLKENTAEAYIQGVESDIEIKISNYLIFRNSITYSYGHNTTKDEPYRRIPPLNILSGLTYRNKNFTSGINMLFASKQDRLAGGDIDDNRIPEGGTPGWKVINVNAAYRFKNWGSLTTGINNLFDEAYRSHGSGVEGYGRSFWIGLSANFSQTKN